MKTKIMGKMRKSLLGLSVSGVNMLALLIVVLNVNATCTWYMNQPEVPESLKRYIKD